jgi:hypothetical protein
VITIDLAPLAVAPDTKPTELPPGPQQAEAEPEPELDPVKPVEKLELPPKPKAERPMAVTPPPMPLQKPKEEKPKQQHASLPSALSIAAAVNTSMTTFMHVVTLSNELLAAPPIELWPNIVRRVMVPHDVEAILLIELEPVG